MGYYGNNDWRDYLAHYGTPRHSGRYPWGSGKKPRQGTVGYYQGRGEALGSAKWKKDSSNSQVAYYKTESSDHRIKKKVLISSRKYDVKVTNPSNGEINCMLCTAAYELRRRGYDVVAKGDDAVYKINDGEDTPGVDPTLFTTWFPKAEQWWAGAHSDKEEREMKRLAASEKGNVEFATSITNELQKQGVGARGNLMMKLSDDSGHSMSYEVTKKGVKLYDGQLGLIIQPEEAADIFARTLGASYIRLDNVSFDEEKIFEAIQNRK